MGLQSSIATPWSVGHVSPPFLASCYCLYSTGSCLFNLLSSLWMAIRSQCSCIPRVLLITNARFFKKASRKTKSQTPASYLEVPCSFLLWQDKKIHVSPLSHKLSTTTGKTKDCSQHDFFQWFAIVPWSQPFRACLELPMCAESKLYLTSFAEAHSASL